MNDPNPMDVKDALRNPAGFINGFTETVITTSEFRFQVPATVCFSVTARTEAEAMEKAKATIAKYPLGCIEVDQPGLDAAIVIDLENDDLECVDQLPADAKLERQ